MIRPIPASSRSHLTDGCMIEQPKECVPRRVWKCLRGVELHASIMKEKYRGDDYMSQYVWHRGCAKVRFIILTILIVCMVTLSFYTVLPAARKLCLWKDDSLRI